jgi:hypothetical protein
MAVVGFGLIKLQKKKKPLQVERFREVPKKCVYKKVY